jgi:hypothetical protein
VRRIQAREFAVAALPESAICKECDLRSRCVGDGTLARMRGIDLVGRVAL